MKTIAITLMGWFFFFNQPEITKKEPEYETIKARITYYRPCPIWGRQVADPNTKRAVKGESVAAHPDFPFGTKIYIPKLDGVIDDGHFVVHDRGPAVTRKTASKGKAYVFDIFVHNQQDIRKYQKHGDYMEVRIFKEKS
jgi:3D (Asp-Asp-Asp) domain-containing protein